ncbi:MAG: hypothetical protein AAF672_01560 [Pseudomonadota bacterium]
MAYSSAYSGASAVARPRDTDLDTDLDTGLVDTDRAPSASTRPLRSHPAFATAAYTRLLDAVGWHVVASPRRDQAYHTPQRCCFVLRDGSREEAAFGYTSITAPLDGQNPTLVAAQIRVERFLRNLGESSGLLVQNTPLIAFGGKRRERVAVFGGWRLHQGYWRPFLLAPDGLGGIAIQNSFFDACTAPHHLAEIFGAPSESVLPKIADLTSAIADFGVTALTQNVVPGLRIAPFADGWSLPQPGTSASLRPLQPHPAENETVSNAYPRRVNGGPLRPLTPATGPWQTEDEFRFHHLWAKQG